MRIFFENCSLQHCQTLPRLEGRKALSGNVDKLPFFCILLQLTVQKRWRHAHSTRIHFGHQNINNWKQMTRKDLMTWNFNATKRIYSLLSYDCSLKNVVSLFKRFPTAMHFGKMYMTPSFSLRSIQTRYDCRIRLSFWRMEITTRATIYSVILWLYLHV